MTVSTQHEYLQALGIEVWIPRFRNEPVSSLEAEANLLPGTSQTVYPDTATANEGQTGKIFTVGPGEGNILLLCGHSSEAATPLAADIARALDSEPVWAWPVEQDTSAALSLEQAIEERLFTRVVVFGNQVAGLSGAKEARVIFSARVICAESIPVLVKNHQARKALWLELSTGQWCAGRANKS